ncbi:MAG: hypothetical protein H0U10_10210 [Chloroflexia bacterium]|nr:hypothetical protein [Chloroflexia bacterium]
MATSDGGGQSKVQQGERPRRNPALTEESGPVLPPPRSSKRYPLEPGFETLMRIDAGALGTGAADDRSRDSGSRSPSSVTPATNRADKERRADAAKTPQRTDRASDSDRQRQDAAPRTEAAAGRAPTGPVPIEAGVVIENPTAEDVVTADDEAGDAQSDRESGATLTNIVGWQANPSPDREAEGAEEAGDGSPAATAAPRSSRDRASTTDRDDSRRPEWDRDRHYKGGEATKRAEVQEIAGTSEDDLYLTQRSGKGDTPESFVYAIPVGADGVFRVRLHFVEAFFGADEGGDGKAGQRVFDVEAEGEKALEGFDIFDEVGSMTAVVKMFDIEVDDGTLELEFVGRKGQPVVSAIEVLRHVGDVDGEDGDRSNWSTGGPWRFRP